MPVDRKHIYSSYGVTYENNDNNDDNAEEKPQEEETKKEDEPENIPEDADLEKKLTPEGKETADKIAEKALEDAKVENIAETKTHVFSQTENLIKEEIPKEILCEEARVAEELALKEDKQKEHHVEDHEKSPAKAAQISPNTSPKADSPYKISPKHAQFVKTLKTISPKLSPEFGCHSYWSIEIKVDEIDDLEGL